MTLTELKQRCPVCRQDSLSPISGICWSDGCGYDRNQDTRHDEDVTPRRQPDAVHFEKDIEVPFTCGYPATPAYMDDPDYVTAVVQQDFFGQPAATLKIATPGAMTVELTGWGPVALREFAKLLTDAADAIVSNCEEYGDDVR